MKESPILSFLGLSLLAFALAAPLQAKDGDETPNQSEKTTKQTDKKAKNEAGGLVAEAIKDLEQDLFNAEVNLDRPRQDG